MHAPDSIERFSNRVANYIKYRPGYPREIIDHLAANCGLTVDSVVVDIGCGPGISSQIFLEHGNRVIGVEPNQAMRAAAADILAGFSNFSVVDGTSEDTTLPTACADVVIAAQAFHWFHAEKTKPELNRILKPSGHIVLIWNERQLDSTPFLIEYERFLLKYANDYSMVRHENVDALRLGAFLGKDYGSTTFQNLQVFDFDGLKGRLLSSSYMPSEADAVFDPMIGELRELFAKHSENDRIKVFYDTNVYYSRSLIYGSTS